MTTNYLNNRRNMSEPWFGYFCAKLQRDGQGVWFPHGALYVAFEGEELVGEFTSSSDAQVAFLRGDRKANGIRLKDYKGMEKKHG